jgi:hypothetical protein
MDGANIVQTDRAAELNRVINGLDQRAARMTILSDDLRSLVGHPLDTGGQAGPDWLIHRIDDQLAALDDRIEDIRGAKDRLLRIA